MHKSLIVDPRIRGKIEDLVPIPIVVRVTDFNEAGAKAFYEDIEKATNTKQPIIPVMIDSYGGEVYACLDMMSHMLSLSTPIATIVTGKAMSCGAMLFAMGKTRYMAPNATLMLHDVSAVIGGKMAELKSSAKEAARIQKLIFSLISKNIGKPNKYFTDILHEKSHAEWYIGVNEAKRHNICTNIGVPKIITRVTLSYEFQ